MKVRPYEKVSLIYDSLMEKVDYSSWAAYILKIAQLHSPKFGKSLELGAGSGKISEQIFKRFKYYLATDISFQMLKSIEDNGFHRLCCNMASLPFKTNFDFIFSAFDSVNYLLRQKDLAALFREVSKVLDDEGSFTFDVSLESNSIYLVKPQTIQGRKNGFWYERISFYKKLSRIHHNRFYISDGHSNNYREYHKQKIYRLETYFKLAESCGFKVSACYDCFTFNDIKSNSNRAQFVFKKIK